MHRVLARLVVLGGSLLGSQVCWGDPHVCGHRPVMIQLEVQEAAECFREDGECRNVLVRLHDDVYRVIFKPVDRCHCPAKVLATRQIQYSDWPECPQSHPQ